MGKPKGIKPIRTRVILISEHLRNGSPVGSLTGDLYDFLREDPSCEALFFYCNTPYQPGGLSPGRLFNALRMHLTLPFWLLLQRVVGMLQGVRLKVVCTSNPPLLYISSIVCCVLYGLECFVWFQDANLDFLSRKLRTITKSSWGRSIFSFIAASIDYVDVSFLRFAKGIVVLDDAMKHSLMDRGLIHGNIHIVYPWATYMNPPVALRMKERGNAQEWNILYAGNYGKSHDLTNFAELLRGLSPGKASQIHMSFVGMSDAAQSSLRGLFKATHAKLSFYPRFPDAKQLLEWFPNFDFGLVSLADSYAGISCPSKVYSYLSQGLPILYIGPEGTLAKDLVEKGWGLDLHMFSELIALENAAVPIKLQSKEGSVLPDPKESSLLAFRDCLLRA